ncbi:MAG: tetratricopeptide repeat protein [Candidatus Acidiferrales bacterium]
MDAERFKRAVSLRDTGDSREAAREFHALARDAADPVERAMILLNESTCLCQMGNTVAARKCWLEASSLVPKENEFRASIEDQEAFILVTEDRTQEALEILDRIVAKYGSLLARSEKRHLYERIQANRGSHLVYLGRFSDARPLLEEALSFDEAIKGARFYYDLGLMYFHLDQLSPSKEHFEKSLRMGLANGWGGQAHYYLGLIYAGEGALAKAKNELELSLGDIETSKLSKQDIYRRLTELSTALGLHDQAQAYKQLMNGG